MKTYNVTLTHKQMQIIEKLTGLVDEDFAKENDITLTDDKWEATKSLYDLASKELNS